MAATPHVDPTMPHTDTSPHTPLRAVHQTLRRHLQQGLQQLDALAQAAPPARDRLLAALEDLLHLCTHHMAHEQRTLVDALRARAPRATSAIQIDHDDLHQQVSRLHTAIQALRQATDAPTATYALTLQLTQFIGDKLVHMVEEETALTRALLAHFSESERASFARQLQVALDAPPLTERVSDL